MASQHTAEAVADGQVMCRGKCIKCKKLWTVTVSHTAYQRWLDGAYAQDAFPSLSPAQRELLISGCCGLCFDEMFKEDS